LAITAAIKVNGKCSQPHILLAALVQFTCVK